MSTDGGGWTLLSKFVYNSSFPYSEKFLVQNNAPTSLTADTSGTHNWRIFYDFLVASGTILKYSNTKNSNNRYEKFFSYSDYTNPPNSCTSVYPIGGDNNGTKVDTAWNGTFSTTARGNAANIGTPSGINRGPGCNQYFNDTEGISRRYACALDSTSYFVLGDSSYTDGAFFIWFKEA